MCLTLPICAGKCKQEPRNHHSLQIPTRLSEKTPKSLRNLAFNTLSTCQSEFHSKTKLAQASPKQVRSEKTPKSSRISRSNSLNRVEQDKRTTWQSSCGATCDFKATRLSELNLSAPFK